MEQNENISFYKGEASFTGNKQVSVGDEKISANKVFINVGGRPFVPETYTKIPYLTSTSILELEEIPEHLIIVGGSYIGLEFGQMFRRFGSRVSIVERNETIIGKEDPEISESILEFLKAEGIEFRLQATCIGAEKNADNSLSVSVDCKLDGPPTIEGSHFF